MPASSLSRLGTLGVLRGHDVEIRVRGRQAREALDHLVALAARGFDEPTGGGTDRAGRPTVPKRPTHLPETADTRPDHGTGGVAASPGIGIGAARSVPLGYLPMPAEANPFLGVRGIRLSLARPELLADQLLAMVRLAHDVPVSLMFPMVSTLDELLRAA